MPVERSAGIILFRQVSSERHYLVIRSARLESQISEKKSVTQFWDFPKGRLESGETGLQAAEREVREEVGIVHYGLVPEFKKTVQYFTRREGKSVPKFVALFLAEVKDDPLITLSWEHDKYEWLSYPEAHERLTHPQMKNALQVAEQYLHTHDSISEKSI